jgi:hypothetical protein
MVDEAVVMAAGIDLRAYSPVLRQASLPPDTTVTW